MRLGDELKSVLEQLRTAYPGGVVPEEDYWALLAVLQADMSIEALSKVVAELVDDEIAVIENHVADAVSRRRPTARKIERVRNKLTAAGWEPQTPPPGWRG